MNKELERSWLEDGMALFELLSQKFLEGTEEIHKKSQSL
jgi:hypothetical protein